MTKSHQRALAIQKTDSARANRTSERESALVQARIPAAMAAQKDAELASEDARLRTSSAEASALTDAPLRTRRTKL